MKKFCKRGTIFYLCHLPLVACMKDQLLGFIFNNRSLFVNSSLNLILCGHGVCICKIKKNKVPYHAVADNLLAKWSPKNCDNQRQKR